MSSTTVVTLGIQYTPPSAPVNSGQSTFSVTAIHSAQNVGQIDVNSTDIPTTVFVIPFGSVAAAKVAIVKNLMSSDVGIRINGSVTDNFRLAAGGELAYACQTAPNSSPLASISVVTTASPGSTENISYWIMGD